MHGLEACVDEMLEEGVDGAIERHRLSAEVARAGVRGLGLELWPANDDIAAYCVTSVRLPNTVDHLELRTLIRDRYGVMLSSGQGAGNLIRIAHMGPTASGLYPVVGIAALGRALVDLGISADIGGGLEAALSALSAQS
jgi:pyridoxamine--pyruvate transaminase